VIHGAVVMVWLVLCAAQDVRQRLLANRLGAGDVKLLAALALVSDAKYLLWSFVGAAVANLVWLILAPTLWPHMNQHLKKHMGYLAPGVSKKQPFAPFLLVGFSVAWFWIH